MHLEDREDDFVRPFKLKPSDCVETAHPVLDLIGRSEQPKGASFDPTFRHRFIDRDGIERFRRVRLSQRQGQQMDTYLGSISEVHDAFGKLEFEVFERLVKDTGLSRSMVRSAQPQEAVRLIKIRPVSETVIDCMKLLADPESRAMAHGSHTTTEQGNGDLTFSISKFGERFEFKLPELVRKAEQSADRLRQGLLHLLAQSEAGECNDPA